jgi:PAS domain S-box-containing protein
VNPAFTRITGYAPEEAIGGNPRMLKSGKHEPALYVDLWATIKAGKDWRGELVNQRKDGSLYTAETTIAPVREAAGTTRFVAIAQDVTARLQADERLRLQAAALGAADNAVMITDREGKIAWVNQAFSRLTGWSEEQCGGKTPRILKSGGHDRQFYEDLWRTILGGDVWRREMINRRKGGEPYIEDQTITPVRDRAGEITHFVAIKIDIGERKRAEEALRHSEARYRALFEQSPDGVLLIDADTGKTIEANEAASRQLGYTREEFAGLRISDYEAGEAPEETQRRIRKVIAEGSDDFETTQRTRNGEIRNVHVWAKRVQLEGRLAFHCIFEDTTDRKRTEASLRSSEQRYRALFDRNLAGVYRTTLDGRVLECNEAFARIFGFASREDALRSNSDAVYAAPADRETFVAMLKVEGVAINHEFVGRRPDGGTLWLLENAHLVAGERPEDAQVIEGTLLDITDRKEAEEAQLASLHEKEALLKEVHHRVKNNLQVITSLLRIEGRRADHQATKSVLAQMQDRIQSMALLHETLYRSGNFARVDLASYLRQLSEQLFRSLGTRPGAVRLNVDLVPVFVEIDKAIPCGLIVNELVTNSLKHGFPEGVTGELWVRLQRSEDGTTLALSVSDNGAGLPRDFDLRRQNSLGLQLVSDLARQLQGSLKIGPGPEAVFEVTCSVTRTGESPRPL